MDGYSVWYPVVIGRCPWCWNVIFEHLCCPLSFSFIFFVVSVFEQVTCYRSHFTETLTCSIYRYIANQWGRSMLTFESVSNHNRKVSVDSLVVTVYFSENMNSFVLCSGTRSAGWCAVFRDTEYYYTLFLNYKLVWSLKKSTVFPLWPFLLLISDFLVLLHLFYFLFRSFCLDFIFYFLLDLLP